MKKFGFLLFIVFQFFQSSLCATYEYTEDEIDRLRRGIVHYEKKEFEDGTMKRLNNSEKGQTSIFLDILMKSMKRRTTPISLGSLDSFVRAIPGKDEEDIFDFES